jgi:hypothetical protein
MTWPVSDYQKIGLAVWMQQRVFGQYMQILCILKYANTAGQVCPLCRPGHRAQALKQARDLCPVPAINGIR